MIENSALGSRHFQEKKSDCPLQLAIHEGLLVWCTTTGSGYRLRIESEDGKPKYIIENQEPGRPKTYTVREVVEGGQRTILPPEALPSLFLEIEAPEYILPKTDDGRYISSISFTRFGSSGLTFIFDSTEQIFRNSENRDEILLADQYLRGAPRLKHKLILRDEKTRKKRVLVPGHKLAVKESSLRSALDTDSDLDALTYDGQIAIYSYRKEKDHLISETTEGDVYLAYTFLWQQQYEESARILESIPQLPLSKEAIKTLKWIFKEVPPTKILIALRFA